MIDAAKFATAYTAFWNMATPTCEHFVRKLNTRLYDRIDPPMKKSETRDRAFIAEFSFALFAAHVEGKMTGRSQADVERSAEEEARRRLAPFQRQGLALPETLDPDQMSEVGALCHRLRSFFTTATRNIFLRPSFAGCGLIDKSEGDVVWGTSLYEIKTVDRPFRSNDIRQLLIYSALNRFSGRYQIDRVGVFNPRRGMSFETSIEEIAGEVSGRSPSYLYEKISQVISSGEISR